MNEKRWWWLDVSGYGDWAFWGTKTEARLALYAKVEWEGTRGRIHKSLPPDEMIDDAIRRDHEGFDPAHREEKP